MATDAAPLTPPPPSPAEAAEAQPPSLCEVDRMKIKSAIRTGPHYRVFDSILPRE